MAEQSVVIEVPLKAGVSCCLQKRCNQSCFSSAFYVKQTQPTICHISVENFLLRFFKEVSIYEGFGLREEVFCISYPGIDYIESILQLAQSKAIDAVCAEIQGKESATSPRANDFSDLFL